ncbi:MAG: hypothetical protein H6730_01760 [Deltaproteobacteria bacterium]|nr:hypothetical protein [Deltaproteobacteria bacterium]
MSISAPILVSLAAFVPLPGTSSVSVPMQPPLACEPCHGDLDGGAFDTWKGSVMGHAARDPLYLAALSEAERDVPGVGDYCLRCHAPEAWVQGRCFPTDGQRLLPEDSGVTCATCHRMRESPWQRNGQFWLAEDLVYRGPYAETPAPHEWAQSDFISDSRLCGTCHDLRNPLVRRLDLDGQDTGQPFPEQTTYTEWATSAFAAGPQARSCQSCHMPEGEGVVGRTGPIRTDRSDHGIAGANTFLPAAIAFLYPELGLGEALALGEAANRESLARAATLTVEAAPGMVQRGVPVSLTFRITNLTGHKLPTGYPEGRRMWLEVRAPDLGLARGTYDALADAIAAPAALYRAVHGQRGIGPGYRLALNDTIYFDNRIPPQGFVPTATTAPVGKVYPEVAPGILAHWDDVTVTGTVACDSPAMEVHVDAVLWYQTVTKVYVDSLVRDQAGSIRGQTLEIAYQEVNPGPEEMARVSVRIPVDSIVGCDPPDAGTPDTGVEPDAGRPDTGVDAGVAAPDAGQPEMSDGGCDCQETGGGPVGLTGLALLCLGAALARRARPRKDPK